MPSARRRWCQTLQPPRRGRRPSTRSPAARCRRNDPRRGSRRRFDRQLGRRRRPRLGAPLPAAGAPRPADRLLAPVDAVLVVRRPCRRARPQPSQSLARPFVFLRRLRHARVERTRSRPIPSGQVTVASAAAFLALQALVGLAVLLQFNRFTIYVGFASLAVVVVYPFMKRITYWPQIVLGLAFSWGALMGWPATFARLDPPALLLYAGAISWVIGYDTIYAHQDREDDALIGIKSTALLFRERTKPMLALFYALAVALIALAGWSAGAGLVFAFGLIAFAGHLAWQVVRLDVDDPLNCLVVFKSNRDAGLILFAGLVLDALLPVRL